MLTSLPCALENLSGVATELCVCLGVGLRPVEQTVSKTCFVHTRVANGVSTKGTHAHLVMKSIQGERSFILEARRSACVQINICKGSECKRCSGRYVPRFTDALRLAGPGERELDALDLDLAGISADVYKRCAKMLTGARRK